MNARKSPQQWQQLVQLWQDSDLTVKEFCQTHNIAPSNFYAQRKRFQSAQSKLPDLSQLEHPDWQLIQPPVQPDSPLNKISNLTEKTEPANDWDIELTLPGGVILRMRN